MSLSPGMSRLVTRPNSVENIKAEGGGVKLLIASGREKKEEEKKSKENQVYSLKQFCYDKEVDVWQCPGSQVLRRCTGEGWSSLCYVCADCAGCKLGPHCLKPNEDRRVLVVAESQLLLGEMRGRLKKPEEQAIYRKREWVAEQPIGLIKEGMGFRGVTMRGEIYAHAMAVCLCCAQPDESSQVHSWLKEIESNGVMVGVA